MKPVLQIKLWRWLSFAYVNNKKVMIESYNCVSLFRNRECITKNKLTETLSFFVFLFFFGLTYLVYSFTVLSIN